MELLFGPVPTSVEDDFADTLTDFWISFVADLNPGGLCKCSFILQCDIDFAFRKLATIYLEIEASLATPPR